MALGAVIPLPNPAIDGTEEILALQRVEVKDFSLL